MKKETLEEFLARGGKIERAETVEKNISINSRYKQKDLDNHDHNNMTRVRAENLKKANGGKLPKDYVMYLKFAKRFL